MKGLHIVSFILLVIGGLNWLVLGIANWDIGELFGGQDAIVSRIIYVLVGIAAIVAIATHKKTCKECTGGGSSSASMMEGSGESDVPREDPTSAEPQTPAGNSGGDSANPVA